MINNEAELMREFSRRASAAGLEIGCLGSGKLSSEIVIIAERPAQRECEMKMPLVGASGNFLWTVLGKIGINRMDCYVTNVIKRQVHASLYGSKIHIKKDELVQWEQLLQWELDQLPSVKYILVLGSFAIQAMVGERKITDWRGSVTDVQYGGVTPLQASDGSTYMSPKRLATMICTLNPAATLWDAKWEPVFLFDMARFQRVMNGSFIKHVVKPIINPSPLEAADFLVKMLDEKKPLSFDIETIAGETACVGFANNSHEGMCINFRGRNDNRWSTSEEREVRRRIHHVLNSDLPLIAQNGNFDSYWLWYKDRIKVKPLWFDTLLAHHTLYPRLPHSLAFLTAQYTEHPYYKDEGKQWREGSDIDEFWEYNVKDACITWAVHAGELQELKDQKLDKFFFEHVMRLQPHLVRMTVMGMLADLPLKDKIAEDLRGEVDDQERHFYAAVATATGDNEYRPNPDSPAQKRELFFNRLNLVGRGVSTDEENRNRMRANPRITTESTAVLDCLDSYLKGNKFLSTYAQMKVDEDSRIRCEYKQFGTTEAPGRLSSSRVMWGTGMNLQNQPKKAYPMFIADDGYVLTYFDLKQAEAKVVAHLWKVPALIENFRRAALEEGFDIHRGNAARIFQKPYDEIPKEDREDDGTPTLRYLGKRCVHGLNYRMGPEKLASVCKIPLSQAMSAYASYHRAFPEIQEGWKQTIELVKKTKQLFTPLGRRLLFLEPVTDENTDSVIAFIPQSTIGDKAASVIYLAEDDPDWPKGEARIWIDIHDALIALHKPEHTAVVSAIMKKYAEQPIIINDEPVVIFSDFKHSQPDEHGIHRWSTIKEVEEDEEAA